MVVIIIVSGSGGIILGAALGYALGRKRGRAAAGLDK